MTKFLNKFSEEIYNQTYKFYKDKDIHDTHLRIAKDLASLEKDPEYWTKKFLEILADFKFVPAGRINSNAGTGLKGTTYINCFVHGFTGKAQDSMNGIMEALKNQALILKSEGGYGFCADVMRPRGAFVEGIGVEGPGAVKMLEMWDTQSAVITAGSGEQKKEAKGKNKIRKGAQMVTMSCWHPDIEEFITAKQTPGRLTKFNMSVLVSDAFMNAVENNLPWTLEFPVTAHKQYDNLWDGNLTKWKEKKLPTKIYKTYENANELWDLIMKSTYNRNEPGVLFIDAMNRLNNLYFCEHISATNPCLTGDTLVYVADGRGNIPIKQLADEGKDVPVFCLDSSGKITIRIMRNPRITGYNEKIYKVTLDDGSVVKATGNHKFLLKNGEYKQVKDFKYGDSLSLVTKFEGPVAPKNYKNRAKDYVWLKVGESNVISEHRAIAEFHNNKKITKGLVVHHKDFNSKNNAPWNLEIMTEEDHVELHKKNMVGDNNPMRRAHKEWSKEKWDDYHNTMSKAVSGPKNGRWIGISDDDLRLHALKLTNQLGHRFSTKEWQEYALALGLPSQFSKWRNDHHGGILGLAKWAAFECGLENVDADPRSQKKYKELTAEGYNCVFENNLLFVLKHCEICSKELKVRAEHREVSICSKECQAIFTKRHLNDSGLYLKAIERSRETYKKQSEQKREQQTKIYSDLCFKLKRDVIRKEWEAECKKQGVICRIGNGSPFTKWSDLKNAAKDYNHKVISIEEIGYDVVYNGTVDTFHNFLVGGFVSNEQGKEKTHYLVTKNCGEQILPVGGSCLLGSINLTQFVDLEKQDWDYEKLGKAIPAIVRLMDNVNDKTKVPLPIQEENLKNKRRIGLGYMGYGSALFMLKLKYGSKKALEITDKLGSFVINEAYKASALIAKEKGSFKLYDEEKYLNSAFIKMALLPETIAVIKKYGLRNSHLSSIQPTGTSSIYANNVSGGLEPVFMPEYIRTSIVPSRPEGLSIPVIDWANKTYKYLESEPNQTQWLWVKEGDENLLLTNFKGLVYKIDQARGLLVENKVQDYGVQILSERNEWDPSAEWAVDTEKLTIDDHVSTMKVFAKYIDSAMSKTVNLPKNYPYEDFKRLYKEIYKSGIIKGCTTYRAGTMTSVLSAESSAKEASKDNELPVTVAPKRPKSLSCDIFQVTASGQKWIVFVGLMGEAEKAKPYEVFAFRSERLGLPTSLHKGTLTKVKKNGASTYDLECADGWTLRDLKSHFESDEQEALTRMISTALRHGAESAFIVEQLQKSEGTVVSFSKAIARTLKKYIKEDSAANLKCSDCGSTSIVMQEGCFVCKSCGSSKCS